MKARLTALAGLLLLTPVFVCAAADPVTEASRFLERGNYRAAAERLRTAAPFAREQVTARFLYATALAGAGERDKAVALFEQLIADYPVQPEPYNNLAALYASQGQLDKAKEVLERAMRTSASYAAVYDNLSAIYVEMARASYVKALRVNETPPAPNLQLLYAVNTPAEDKATPPGREMLAAAEAPTPPEPKSEVKAAIAPEPVIAPKPEAKPVVAPEPAKEPKPELNSAEPLPPAAVADAPPAPAPQQAVLTALQDWARAWSARDVEAYLGYYAADFNPVGSQTRDQWVAERRERLAKAESISVVLENPQVKMVNPRRAIVTLVQQYTASNYSDNTRKQITLVKVGERWLIRNEKGLGVVR